MTTPKKIIIKDLELADEEIVRLRKENKEQKEELNFYYKAAKQFRKDKDVLMKENEELEKENKGLKDDNKLLIETNERLKERNRELFDENKELKEKLDKFRTDNIYEE